MTDLVTIGPEKLRFMYNEQVANLVDVRTPEEFAQSHIEGAVNVPLEFLQNACKSLSALKDIVLVCRTGKRAEKARQILFENGLDAQVLEGGIDNWTKASMPITSARMAPSMEQQVRIFAGLFVLTGVALSLFVDRLWLLLTAFVGCGLIFAGLTGSCALASVLSKCPWNKTASN